MKKISVVDIKSDSQIEKLSDRIIWTLEKLNISLSHFEIYRGKKEYVEKSKQKIKKYSCENIDVYHTVFSTFPGDIFYADDWNCKWK